jgi:hypothetical protein
MIRPGNHKLIWKIEFNLPRKYVMKFLSYFNESGDEISTSHCDELGDISICDCFNQGVTYLSIPSLKVHKTFPNVQDAKDHVDTLLKRMWP